MKTQAKRKPRRPNRPELEHLAADLTEVACSVIARWDLDGSRHLSALQEAARRKTPLAKEIERLRKMVIEISPLIKLEANRRFA